MLFVDRFRSVGAGEVVEAGDAEHRDGHAVAAQAAITQDLPGLHPRERMLDAGSDLTVGGVVRLLPVRQVLAGTGGGAG